MFILKKVLGNLTMPLSFSLLLLLLGLCFLWLSASHSNKQWLGKTLITLATGILLLASLPFSSTYLTTSIERDHPPLFNPPTNLSYVIVLGGGHVSDPFMPIQSQLSPASFYRVMEGIRLIKANPNARLLLSGFGGSDPISNAQLASLVAQQNGIAADKIKTFSSAKDTAQEAKLIASVIQDKPTALVTSASHMPRALKLFAELGRYPLPAPTYFLGKVAQNPKYWYEQMPQARDLDKTTVAWHEVVGSAWQKLLNLKQ